MGGWNGWYHCCASTYGTWLPGDPRGFRTRHHREHIEGDYRNPPPTGRYEQRHRAAQRRLKRPPVVLSRAARAAAVESIVHALIEVHGIELLAISVGGMHMHVLARFGPVIRKAGEPTALRGGLRGSQKPYRHRELRDRDPARYFMGIAKERSAKALRRVSLAPPGGVWAKRGKVLGIAGRAHQVRVFGYILEHAREGAATWSFRDDVARVWKGEREGEGKFLGRAFDEKKPTA